MKTNNIRLLNIILLLFFTLTSSAQFHRSNRTIAINGEHKEAEFDKGIGLEKVLIFKDLSSASISFTTDKNKTVNFYTYENSIADKDPHTTFNPSPSGENTTYIISGLADNKGLIIDDGTMICMWLIDYPSHKPSINAVAPIESDDRCQMLKLVIDKYDLMEYKGTGGQVRQVDRRYDIIYNIQEWDEESKKFIEKTIIEEDKPIGTEHLLSHVPTINTAFKIVGDQFGKHFTLASEKTSDIYEAIAVQGKIVANQHYRENNNEIQNTDELGGSAPVDIEFLGRGNKPVNFYTWMVYEKNDMNNPIARYTDQDFEYTFNQFGNYQVVLEVANAESTCVDSTSVSFDIRESDLKVPNFFSPGSTPGSNDVWKVAYKSLVKYKCVIFNRWGNKIFETSDPSQGWDGRYKGTLVHPGVYYYSIEATGSDGVKYNKGGDINILR